MSNWLDEWESFVPRDLGSTTIRHAAPSAVSVSNDVVGLPVHSRLTSRRLDNSDVESQSETHERLDSPRFSHRLSRVLYGDERLIGPAIDIPTKDPLSLGMTMAMTMMKRCHVCKAQQQFRSYRRRDGELVGSSPFDFAFDFEVGIRLDLPCTDDGRHPRCTAKACKSGVSSFRLVSTHPCQLPTATSRTLF